MNKNGVKLIAAACAALMASTANAQTRGGFEVGAEVFDYSYREREGGQIVVRDDGIFGGGSLGYVETIGGGAFVRSRLNLAFGSVDYRSVGPALGGPGAGESRLDNVSQSIGQLEIHLGKDFSLGGITTLTPFIGLGSRYLEDNGGGKKTDDGLFAYDREVSYGYVPIGLSARAPFGRGSSIVFSAQYNWVVDGKSKSKFSEIDPALPDINVNLDKGHGFEFSALVSLPVGARSVSFGPFMRHWNIDQSESFILKDPDGSGEALEFFEPRNRTMELGLRASFSF